jgi:dTDP-4-dehydrorhamnose reductase
MKILVTGASGQVGTELVAELERRSHLLSTQNHLEVISTTHGELDLTVRDDVHQLVRALRPDLIIHPAGFTAVDLCESEVDRAFAVNGRATGYLDEAAEIVGAHLCYLSTDYVFDGTSPRPYVETDEPNPQSIYGKSKLAGEQALRPSATIIRTSWVCGSFGSNMVKTIMRLATTQDGPLRFVDDQHGCPTIVADLVPTLIDLATGRRPGIFHVTNQGATTWYDFARAVVGFTGGDEHRVEPIKSKDLVPPRPAPRPANSILDNRALNDLGAALLPDWHESTAALVRELLT